MSTWTLHCSNCEYTAPGDRLASLCPNCSQPLVVRLTSAPPKRDGLKSSWSLWRYADAMPLAEGEKPVTLGEGMTPMLDVPALAKSVGVRRLWVKDEGVNPTGSFKARGMAAAVTRAKALGVKGLVVPTAGNAGAALAAYAAAAQVPVRIWAPATTPPPILNTVRAMGADLVLVDGHIGDAGKAAMQFAKDEGWFNIATVREPYRVEGMKTMGLEVAEQLGWRLPDVIVYPTGGGEGTIGIWKAIDEMIGWGWLPVGTRRPKMVIAQAEGCAPLVRAFAAGQDHATAWEGPVTYAAGLRVPGPLGDRLVLRTLRQSEGAAATANEEQMKAATFELASSSGIDAAPEGGCALHVTRALVKGGVIAPDAEVVVFNTGSGSSYRW
ncbi:MAG: threonine synthase [Gemmatimonadetes bacterium]|nr:threonine synthase [Gemmatimonadota bacterium]